MFRLSSNCSTIVEAPSRLEEVISVTPAMRPNWRSSGVATDDDMVSALAPGSAADTWMVGNSTCGSGETGKSRYDTTPASARPAVRSEVATGLRMNGDDRLTATPPSPAPDYRHATLADAAPAGRNIGR